MPDTVEKIGGTRLLRIDALRDKLIVGDRAGDALCGLIALKTRNRIIFSPHPRAHRSTNKAARLVHDAAIAAGAPAGIVGWIEEPTVEVSNALMRHPDINLTLATGRPGMVKAADPRAHEQVHNAATIAGIAFANTFLGVCHAMAHKTGAQFNIPHGSANAMLIANVVRYAEIARHLGFGGTRDHQRVELLVGWIEGLKWALDVPPSIKERGVRDADLLAEVHALAEAAFDDQCTGANPRYPLISELKQILLDGYYGRAYVDPALRDKAVETAQAKPAARSGAKAENA